MPRRNGSAACRAGAKCDAADGVFSSDRSRQSQTRPVTVAVRDPWLAAAGDDSTTGRREHCRTAEMGMQARHRQACEREKMTMLAWSRESVLVSWGGGCRRSAGATQSDSQPGCDLDERPGGRGLLRARRVADCEQRAPLAVGQAQLDVCCDAEFHSPQQRGVHCIARSSCCCTPAQGPWNRLQSNDSRDLLLRAGHHQSWSACARPRESHAGSAPARLLSRLAVSSLLRGPWKPAWRCDPSARHCRSPRVEKHTISLLATACVDGR
ncbi:hypothetical protein K491DRAFT_679656 [Lophiostoma macrostomum CBS 122681]|uniref:Uncharacterized protein n=1 Tax=Lophiostoma macrostomum CBS 122681 TaxID=1314788 RepID=A0A6A6T6Q7_9PLEO|nr:hypothetical protein K491DRAFT_679656 [Lophiostoma macrostomum CBS 122681]